MIFSYLIFSYFPFTWRLVIVNNNIVSVLRHLIFEIPSTAGKLSNTKYCLGIQFVLSELGGFVSLLSFGVNFSAPIRRLTWVTSSLCVLPACFSGRSIKPPLLHHLPKRRAPTSIQLPKLWTPDLFIFILLFPSWTTHLTSHPDMSRRIFLTVMPFFPSWLSPLLQPQARPQSFPQELHQ